ncbi:carbohydrate porin [Roseivirga misakiensis]|uniref:Porin n=1 Tax=Roseivirga misakiensis TaxID=1563681 RepID=A0A1E5T0Y3_9BACT|nr:carbohydrate porin [Roseivirga misakiensis]OEK05043.1 hypothetical protein BFP71_16625 [Roseivirga misakiensis]
MIKGLRLNGFLLLLYPILFLRVAEAQTLEFNNATVYQTEILFHTSKNPGDDFHFLGWLLNSSELRLSQNHRFQVDLSLTHGQEPSADIVGDLQTFSNLEAGFSYGFYEAYYQFEHDDFWIKIGQQDINTDFLVSESGALFTHSSFGIDPVATINMPAPTYPATALAITSHLQLNENLGLLLGVFDGQFANPKNDFIGINWSIDKNDGLIYIIEPELSLFKGKMKQKIGYYHHSGLFTDLSGSGLRRGLSAFYLVTDLNILKREEKEINLFLQFDRSTKAVSDLKHYFGFGLKFNNLIQSRELNELGIGIGHAALNTRFSSVSTEYDIQNETFLELNYKHQLKKWLSIQPYFQWINIDRIARPNVDPIILAFRAHIEL